MAAILGPLISDKKLNFEQYLLNTHWYYTLQIHGITVVVIVIIVIIIIIIVKAPLGNSRINWLYDSPPRQSHLITPRQTTSNSKTNIITRKSHDKKPRNRIEINNGNQANNSPKNNDKNSNNKQGHNSLPPKKKRNRYYRRERRAIERAERGEMFNHDTQWASQRPGDPSSSSVPMGMTHSGPQHGDPISAMRPAVYYPRESVGNPRTNENSPFQIGPDAGEYPGLYKPADPASQHHTWTQSDAKKKKETEINIETMKQTESTRQSTDTTQMSQSHSLNQSTQATHSQEQPPALPPKPGRVPREGNRPKSSERREPSLTRTLSSLTTKDIGIKVLFKRSSKCNIESTDKEKREILREAICRGEAKLHWRNQNVTYEAIHAGFIHKKINMNEIVYEKCPDNLYEKIKSKCY